MQRWYYRGEADVTNADLDKFGSVECQRFIGFKTGTDENGNEKREIAAKGKWNFIGAPYVNTDAPGINNCSGRLWYNPDNGLLKIYDGKDWQSISPVTVSNSTTTPDVISDMHNFWVNPTSQQLHYYETNSKQWISLGEQDQAKTLVALPYDKTDLNNINVEYAYIQGQQITEAQKASFHYPQDWDIASNPRVITLGYGDIHKTQILHDRTNLNHFFIRFSTTSSWTDWKKFTADTHYVSGKSPDFNDKQYLWPGHYIVKDNGSQDFQHGPDEATGGSGYPAYLDVYQVDSNLICQQWRFRGASTATQNNVSHFASVLCQRYLTFTESTDSNGNMERNITIQGDWAFIGGVRVYNSAPTVGKARGRLWYNPDTGIMKVHDGADWQDINSPIMVSTGASTPSVVSGRQQFWIDPAGTLAYYDASKAKWVNFVNP